MANKNPPTKKGPISEADLAWIRPNVPIWIEQPEDVNQLEIFKEGIIQQPEGENVKVIQLDNPKEIKTVHAFQIYQRNLKEIDCDDMVNMEILNEPELLNNVYLRFKKEQIFTYVGPTLLSINPYRRIPKLFTEQLIKAIKEAAFEANFEKSKYPPHVYSVGCEAYRQLFRNQKKQAICISGESGAGKTENAKMAMNYLTSLSQTNLIEAKSPKNEKSIEDKILSCNPILEAFGNAKTLRNDNSSRFGKYVQLQVELSKKKIIGANTINYLLEKSRITSLNGEERNYHIFYFFCKGAVKEDLQTYFLLNANDSCDLKKFLILNRSTCYDIPNVNDVELYQEVKESFMTMKFTNHQEDAVWRIVSAILQLGNCEIDDSKYEQEGKCYIANTEYLQKASNLLQIDQEKLNNGILNKSRKTPSGIIQSPLSKKDAIVQRDSLMKELYDKLFCWLVKRLNQTIIPTVDYNSQKSSDSDSMLTIGLLDIFGFEVFKINSFEQLCINYTNEKLHQVYIQYIFKQEVKEFEAETLGDQLKTEIKFKDNSELIDVLDSQIGIFSLLDQICQTKGNDSTFYQTISKQFEKNAYFGKTKLSKDTFTIKHTAKHVEYISTDFTFKNQDELDISLEELIKFSNHPLVPLVFQNLLEGDQTPVSLEEYSSKGQKVKFLGAKFRLQMKDLMSELYSCDVHFIRCIKPNEQKSGTLFNHRFTLTQIQYLGVLDSIRIRRETYPVRLKYSSFYETFQELDIWTPPGSLQQRMAQIQYLGEIASKICQYYLPDNGAKQVLFGITKIYGQNEAIAKLQDILVEKRKVKEEAAIQIQKKYFHFLAISKTRIMDLIFFKMTQKARLYLIMRRFRLGKNRIKLILRWWKEIKVKRQAQILMEYTIKIQKMFRGFKVRKRIAKLIKAVSIIENAYKNYKFRQNLRIMLMCKSVVVKAFENAWEFLFKRIREASVLTIQRYWRGYVVRKKHWQKVQRIRKVQKDTREYNNAVKIQKNFRGYIIRIRYQTILSAVKFIQGYFRMKLLNGIFKKLRWAARVIQNAWRPYYMRRKIVAARLAIFLRDERPIFQNQKKIDNEILFPSLKSKAHFEQFMNDRNNHTERNFSQFESTNNINEEEFIDSISGRKASLVTYLVDIEHMVQFCTDSSEIYEPAWAQTYQTLFKHQMIHDSELQTIEFGEYHTVACNIHGKLFSWGWNDYFQLGYNLNDDDIFQDKKLVSKGCNAIQPPSLDNIKIKILSSGDDHTAIIDQNNKLYIWGQNSKGQYGLGHFRNVNQIIRYDAFGKDVNIIDVKCKREKTFIVTEQGQVFAWPTTRSNGDIVSIPQELPLSHKIQIQKLSIGNDFCLLISKNGLIYSTGENDQGQLGLGDNQPRYIPTLIESFKNAGERIVHVSSGFKHVTALSSLGKVFTWGWGSLGQLGTGSTKSENLPCCLDLRGFIGNQKVLQIQASYRSSFILTESRQIFWWGTNGALQQQILPVEFKIWIKLPELRDTKDICPVRLLSSWSKTLSICQITYADMRNVKIPQTIKQKMLSKLTQLWQENLASINPPFHDSFSKYFYSRCMRFSGKQQINPQKIESKSKTPVKVRIDAKSKQINNNYSQQMDNQIDYRFNQQKQVSPNHYYLDQNDKIKNDQQYIDNSFDEVEEPQSARFGDSVEFQFNDFQKENKLGYSGQSTKYSPSTESPVRYNNINNKQVIIESKKSSKDKILMDSQMNTKLREIKKKMDKIMKIPRNKWQKDDIEFMNLVNEPKIQNLLQKLDS